VAQEVALLVFDEERRDELVLVHGKSPRDVRRGRPAARV
jgi:hypothetical protein